MAYQPTDWEHGDIITGGKLNKIEQELTHVADNATYGFGGAQLSSDGLTPFSYINAGDPMPSNPKKGDTVFLKDGNDFLIYSYNGEDWVLKVDPDLSNRIEETIKTASDNTDKAIADNNTQINETINQVAKEQADLAVKDGDFNNKAQAMADKALQDAKNNTATVAKSTLDTANQNIADAKKSVTDDIAQEASDRASAVSALDTKAQGYADTAKKNAIDVATSADGVINKKIDDTASSITSTVSQNKKDAEGKITTAQSTATQALNGLSSKVDTSTYNAKTGQLSTDVTSVTQTANQAKTDIASIKQTDTSQDARMTTIEADANGTKTTVSNLQKTQNTQSGSISTLQQRADGFEATAEKVDSLQVGGRNYLVSGAGVQGWLADFGNIGHNGAQGVVYDYISTSTGETWSYSSWTDKPHEDTSDGSYIRYAFYDKDKKQIVRSNYSLSNGTSKGRIKVTPDNVAYIRVSIDWVANGYGHAKLEKGNLATDYSQAPEDINSATAKAQLTADQATTSLNAYKTDANGRISKAQSDIVQTAKDVTTKVSQSDYDKKTGDLSTSVSKAQQTADSAVTTIGNYKTSNDNRVKATETSIAQNTKDITLRATNTDLDLAKKDYNAQIAQVNVNANAITSQVSNVNSKIDNLAVGGRNYLVSVTASLGWLLDNGNIGHNGAQGVVYDYIPTTAKEVWSYSSWADKPYTVTSEGKYLRYALYDSNKQQIMRKAVGLNMSTDTAKGQIVVDDNSSVAYIRVSIDWVANGYGHAKLEKGNLPTDWTPAPEDVDNKISAQQITINGITDTVSKQGTNIDSVTKRVTTAEGTLSTATNNISGLQSSVTQTANQITQEISDRTTGDSNTLQSSKDFTQSSITNYDKGIQTQITQTANGIIAKVDTKTDSDTVLSLLKNNWSVGITDNISKITSGIVGNASQMSLISKNVTIDTPSTQIKGTAWINSAMIANGAIGSAQIGDATITSAKIATLDVAKLTGNVSNFIQSNWNGLYQSVKISPIGMTISTSQGSTAQFNQDGLVLDGALGTTNVLNGQIELISSKNEYLGTFQHDTMPDHDNVDYLMIKLAGWHTSKPGDSDYDLNSDSSNTIRGGDGIGFGVTNSVGTYDMKMSWDSSLVAGYKGRKAGWHVEDIMTWHQPTYFEGGFDVAQQFSSTDRRALHIQGATLSNGHKWFGFFDTPSKAGFGTDDTNDVLFYVKGKSYSLYTMLNKLSML
ncbi:hypothetical protein ACI5FS_06065 [Leuconostoc mesenteroides]|uniref:hypothetical protein n=1 Tax=Leuconostoc mesenteroides TaxID=1245 RepID=UPI00386A45A9